MKTLEWAWFVLGSLLRVGFCMAWGQSFGESSGVARGLWLAVGVLYVADKALYGAVNRKSKSTQQANMAPTMTVGNRLLNPEQTAQLQALLASFDQPAPKTTGPLN